MVEATVHWIATERSRELSAGCIRRGTYLRRIPSKPALNLLILKQLYRQIDMIKGYSTLNSTGFRKILKKHDKVTGIVSMKATMAKIDAAPFNSFKKLDPVITEIGAPVVDRLYAT